MSTENILTIVRPADDDTVVAYLTEHGIDRDTLAELVADPHFTRGGSLLAAAPAAGTVAAKCKVRGVSDVPCHRFRGVTPAATVRSRSVAVGGRRERIAGTSVDVLTGGTLYPLPATSKRIPTVPGKRFLDIAVRDTSDGMATVTVTLRALRDGDVRESTRSALVDC